MSYAKTIREQILEITGGALVASIDDYIKIVGIKKGTVYNQIHKGIFPLRTVRPGNKVGILVDDIVNLLEGRLPTAPAEPVKRGPGRPRKLAKAGV